MNSSAVTKNNFPDICMQFRISKLTFACFLYLRRENKTVILSFIFFKKERSWNMQDCFLLETIERTDIFSAIFSDPLFLWSSSSSIKTYSAFTTDVKISKQFKNTLKCNCQYTWLIQVARIYMNIDRENNGRKVVLLKNPRWMEKVLKIMSGRKWNLLWHVLMMTRQNAHIRMLQAHYYKRTELFTK